MTYKKTGRLILDSSNPNVTYDSINNIYTFPLSQPITMRKYLKLQGSQIPNAHYNFENNVNNWVDVGVVANGGSAMAYRSFQITAGNYAITDLVTLLQTQFTALGLTWTVSYSDQTSLLSISLTGGQFQLLFSSGSHASQSAWSQLGFNQNVDTPAASTQTGNSPPNLSSPTYVIIDIENCSQIPLMETQGYASGMYCVVFESSKGTIETDYENSTFEQICYFEQPEVFKNLQISLSCHVPNVNGNHPFQTNSYQFILLFEYE